MIHVMMDIETLGNKMGAPVLSAGLAYRKHGVLHTFETHFNLDSQFKKNPTLNQDTLKWWMKQSDNARAVFERLPDSSPADYTVHDAIRELGRFLADIKEDYYIWGYGANFDEPMMEALCTKYGMETPWKYRQSMCFRTIKRMYPSVTVPDVGTSHRAVDDAIWQLNYLEKLIIEYDIKFYT